MRARISLILVVDIPDEPSKRTLMGAVVAASAQLKNDVFQAKNGHCCVGLTDIVSTDTHMEVLK